jgi:hypothetical protein
MCCELAIRMKRQVGRRAGENMAMCACSGSCGGGTGGH